MTGNDGNPILRLARPGERQALEDLQRRASLVSDAYREFLLAHPEAIDLPLARIEAGDVWVAETAGGISGFCVIVPLNRHQAELDGLFVEPGSWGRGLGSALVAKAVDIARMRGADSLLVIAGRDAQSFYEIRGFEVVGEATTRFDTALEMLRRL